jgi:hypothetical protein
MLMSAEAHDLEEDLASLDASIGDLIGGSGAMAGRTWDFGESLVTEKMIKKMEKEGYFSIGRAKLPLQARPCLLQMRVMLWCLGTNFLAAFASLPSCSYVKFLKSSNLRSIIRCPMDSLF